MNSPECANINLAERGVPCNTEIADRDHAQAGQGRSRRSSKFIEDIKPEVADTPIPPPPGGGTTIAATLTRYATDVLFGRASTADAAQKFVDEMKSNLQG